MQDRIVFQPEAFPLELLADEDEYSADLEDSTQSAFEGGELDEERRGGGPRFRQGLSARHRVSGRPGARRRPRPPRRPRRPQPPSSRHRWPYVRWPVGSGVSVINVRADDSGEPQLCPCPPQEEPASTGGSGADAPNHAPDTVGTGDGTEQDELSGNVASRIGTDVGSASARASRALASTNIIDLTASADKSKRKGTRDPKAVYALVLHQMACCFAPKDPLKRFLSVGAHFAITNDGRILQLHPVSALVSASNGFNNRSVAVEFAGNFPSTKGRWWKAETYGMNHPTAAQVTAGRQLIQHLVQTIGLTHVLAHRQSSGTRENDPGPDVWFDVGQWAVNNLGLKDGGPGFRIGTGNPIPDEWRTWGSRRPAVTTQREVDDDAAMPETEIVHDEWDSEYVPASSEESIRHNRYCGCRRCSSVGAGSLAAESFEDGRGSGPAAGGVVQHGRWIRHGGEVVLLGA